MLLLFYISVNAIQSANAVFLNSDLEADEIENVPKRQKTEEIHVQARDTDIKPQNISSKNTVGNVSL